MHAVSTVGDSAAEDSAVSNDVERIERSLQSASV